jgi:hypothetical protein
MTVSLKTDVSNYGALKALLIARYGPPSTTSTKAVQNLMGQTFRSERLSWLGQRVSIVLNERHGKIDQTEVSVADEDLLKKAWAAEQTQELRAASSL